MPYLKHPNSPRIRKILLHSAEYNSLISRGSVEVNRYGTTASTIRSPPYPTNRPIKDLQTVLARAILSERKEYYIRSVIEILQSKIVTPTKGH